MYGYGREIPMGPDRTPEATSKIDRTRILDPEDIWRNPQACPDWPVVGPNQSFSGQRGRPGAEARLEEIGLYLNRGPGALRLPTEGEREQAFAGTFRRTGSNWHAWGIPNLSPLGMMVEGDAQLMAEACHIRGYLRKIEVQEKREAAVVQERKTAEARRTLEDYRANVAGEIEAIEALSEAVARHKQRMEDELAVSRRYGLWQRLNERHGAAVTAAHTLGLSVPDAPPVLEG